jgi:hypothetical protein
MNVDNRTSPSIAASGIGLDAEGMLALLVIERQHSQEDAARDDKLLARDRYVAASNEEVAAMRDKAGDIRLGAIVQGVATAAASCFQVFDALQPGKDELSSATAEFGHGAASVLGDYFGDAPAASEDANAKHASLLAEQARWQLDDAKEVIDKATESKTQAIDWVSSVNANQASAETGIIAGLA